MNTTMDDERDDKGITRNEDAIDDALRRSGDSVRGTADDLGVSADATHVRDALAAHPWPMAGEALMARLHAVPASAASPSKESAPTSSTAPYRDDRGHTAASAVQSTDRQGRDSGRGLRRPRTPFELAAAFAVVAAVVVVLARGAGDVAPVRDPSAADDAATRTAEASAANAIATRTPEAGAPTANAVVDPGDQHGEAGMPPVTSGPVEPAPLPPTGTRLYGSVAELLADPPSAGETVWVDAYHGEMLLPLPGWGRGESITGCPSARVSPLRDRPFLLHLDVFNDIRELLVVDDESSVLMAAGFNEDGQITAFPDLPRHGRLILHLGDPALAQCDDAERIVLVERVAHVFVPKPDWSAIARAIRASESVGTSEISSWIDTVEHDVYRMSIPSGLELVDDPSVSQSLVQSDLPEHPILINYRRGSLNPDERRELLAKPRLYVQKPSGPADEFGMQGPPLAFVVKLDMGAEHAPPTVTAITEVNGTVFELSVTLPEDGTAAQPLLWRFEAVIDRFQVPDPTAVERAAAPSPTGLELLYIDVYGDGAQSIAAADGLAILGGQSDLKVLTIDTAGDVVVISSFDPPPPTALGLVSDADIDIIARQVTEGDRDWAHRILGEPSAPRTVQAVALRPPYGYAVVEWPTGSGLMWLYVLDVEAGFGERFVSAARLELADGAPLRYVSAYDMALAGDHLLVATSAGLFDVDVSVPASPVVRPPSDGPLRGVITAVAAAPDGRRAWACGGQIDAGGINALDLSDPGGIRVLGTRPEPHALLDCATDGSTLFATTGSESHAIARYDVTGGGAPQPVGQIVPANGIGFGLHLFGRRLVVSATDVTGLPRGAYAEPNDPLGTGRTGLLVYDATDPAAPVDLGAIELPDPVEELATAGRFLLAAAGIHGLYVYGSSDYGSSDEGP